MDEGTTSRGKVEEDRGVNNRDMGGGGGKVGEKNREGEKKEHKIDRKKPTKPQTVHYKRQMKKTTSLQ